MSAARVREWQLAARPAEGGLELLGERVSPDALGTTLRSAWPALRVEGRAFLLVRLKATDRVGVEAALGHAAAWAGEVRVSVAIDVATLERIGSGARLGTQGAGLLLDDVDARTPLAALTHESLEAVRFRTEFIASAVRSLRLEYVLGATLGLARNLGLATLGSAEAMHEEWTLASQFDYTSRDVAPARVAPAMLSHRPRHRPEQPRFQLSR